MHINKNNDTMTTLAAAPTPFRSVTPVLSVLTPSTVTHALNVPIFYQQKTQFWNMLNYLFTTYEQKPVWQHLSEQTHVQLAQQLHWAVEALETEAQLFQCCTIFYQTYFVILYATKGFLSQTQWLASSSQDYLQNMYKMYRLLFSVREKLPPLPNFGHHHPSLKK